MVQAVDELKHAKTCLICGHELVQGNGFTTGFLVSETGRELLNRIWFCSQNCVDKFLKYYANPVFQNEKARQLFMTKHPDRYNRIAGKPKLFLEG
jgi:ribosomal protein L24E